jgi:hypothetical protein
VEVSEKEVKRVEFRSYEGVGNLHDPGISRAKHPAGNAAPL